MRLLFVEDEPYLAEAVPDGPRLDPFRRGVFVTVFACLDS